MEKNKGKKLLPRPSYSKKKRDDLVLIFSQLVQMALKAVKTDPNLVREVLNMGMKLATTVSTVEIYTEISAAFLQLKQSYVKETNTDVPEAAEESEMSEDDLEDLINSPPRTPGRSRSPSPAPSAGPSGAQPYQKRAHSDTSSSEEEVQEVKEKFEISVLSVMIRDCSGQVVVWLVHRRRSSLSSTAIFDGKPICIVQYPFWPTPPTFY